MVKSCDLTYVAVSDVAKARKFFTEIVGMEELNYDSEYDWAELKGRDGGAVLGLSKGSEEFHSAGSCAIVTFTVDDLAKTRQEFEAKGVELIGEIMEVPGHVKLQLFLDKDGNKFQLVEKLDNK